MTLRDRFFDLLNRHFSPLQPVSPDVAGRLFAHYELLVRWNAVINLTSIDRLEEVVVRHYCESLFLARLLPPESVSILDIGSGGGFPGIPMAVSAPLNRFVLAESHRRKAVFLREATRDFGNVRVFAGRAEELREEFDWVVSRAVKPAEVLKAARRFGGSVALLMGETDLAGARQVKDLSWRDPYRLPWGEQRVAAIGTWTVPRGT